MASPKTTLPTDSAERKKIPLYRGLLRYFPAALVEAARISQVGNDKHNPGEELHHARGKSTDHADCILRHLTDYADTRDPAELGAIVWRALAFAQEELEQLGAPLAPGARLTPKADPPIGPSRQADTAREVVLAATNRTLDDVTPAEWDAARAAIRDAERERLDAGGFDWSNPEHVASLTPEPPERRVGPATRRITMNPFCYQWRRKQFPGRRLTDRTILS